MKRLSYAKSREIDFRSYYVFLGELLKGCENKHIVESFYIANSLEQLSIIVQDDPACSDYFFTKLKKCADQSDHYIELEKYVIYMDILLGKHYQPLQIYKQKLLNMIIEHTTQYFTSDEYCVIRHLIDFDRWHIEDIIHLGSMNITTKDQLSLYFICEIYLIEQDYKKALPYLDMIRMDGLLLDYEDDIKTYYKRAYWKNVFHIRPFAHLQTAS